MNSMFMGEKRITRSFFFERATRNRTVYAQAEGNLNKLEKPKFRVTVRPVRDAKMVERGKKLEKEEENATGIQILTFKFHF